MHVVFGAAGRAGGETARALIERGEQVRVVVRRPEQGESWKALGAEVAIANLYSADDVSRAMEGASAAFLLSPPPRDGDPFAQAAELGRAIAEAVRRANLAKTVVLSSIGAQHASDTGVIATLHEIETALAGAARATAFLRSGYFIETWSEVAEAAISEGILPSFLNVEQNIPMVSTADVGEAAAQLMTETWEGTRIVELGGQEDWSARDVATAFAEVLGRPIEPVFLPPEQHLAVLTEAGVTPEVATALLGMYDGIARGRVTRQENNEHWRGATPLAAAIKRMVTTLHATP
ncbi:NmrA family NAD(P)-binding protein [Ensifer sp. IC4062]|nr:NmrA family NAD(P)-binding protein [Ensifer sp. IC4062]